jgi:hypothetical protein
VGASRLVTAADRPELVAAAPRRRDSDPKPEDGA